MSMQEQYSLLKQQNYQLKNQISQLKNAFDLNRDILKIISDEAKTTQPRFQILYQIINRLTNINNQIMIQTAQLIHEKNAVKIQKQHIKHQNQLLKQRIDEKLENQYLQNEANKVNDLSIYFKNKINDMENQIKVLEEDRIIKEHQIDFLNRKIQYYEGEQNKISLIPTIDKNNPIKKFIQPSPSSLVSLLQHGRKHSTNKSNKLEIKLSILHKDMSRLKIYSEELQYRLLILIKVLQIEDDIKKKEQQSINKKYKRCLQEQYSQEMTQVRLLKFALNNLFKEQKEVSDLMFSLRNRNLEKTDRKIINNRQKCRRQYQSKSLQKYNKIRMRPTYPSNQKQQEHQENQLQQQKL